MRPIVNCDENDPEILWFCLLRYDWSRNLAPSYQPIRCKTKINMTWPFAFLNNLGALLLVTRLSLHLDRWHGYQPVPGVQSPRGKVESDCLKRLRALSFLYFQHPCAPLSRCSFISLRFIRWTSRTGFTDRGHSNQANFLKLFGGLL